MPGVVDSDEIRTVAASAGLPLNVLVRPNLPSAPELERLGVHRLSAGSAPASSTYARISALTRDFLRDGASAPFAVEAMSYSDINALFAEP